MMKTTFFALSTILTWVCSALAQSPDGTQLTIGCGEFYLKHSASNYWKHIIEKNPGYIPMTEPQRWELGLLYYSRKDFTNAFKVFQAAATNRSSLSQYALSTMYRSGLGVAKDEEMADDYLSLAASITASPDALAELTMRQLDEAKPKSNPWLFQKLFVAGILGNSTAIEVVRSHWEDWSEVYFFGLAHARPEKRDAGAISDPRRMNLKGITSIRVILAPLRSEVMKAGFDPKEIKAGIELRLKDTGLKVEELVEPEDAEKPCLVMDVKLFQRTEGEGYFLHANLFLRDAAIYKFDVVNVPVWNAEVMGYCPTTEWKKANEWILSLVDKFSIEYLKANRTN